MRTLNRPMFRYGGPIKEGVMHGIREPRRNGGSMGNNQGPRRAALVGNPAYPQTDGRAHHLAPLVVGGLYAAGRALARPFGSWAMKQMAKKGVTGGGGIIRSGLGRSRVMQPGESLTQSVNKFTPNWLGKQFINDPLAKSVMTGSNKFGKGIQWTGKKIGGIGKYAFGSPSGLLTTGGISYMFWPDGTPKTKEEIIATSKERRGVSGAPGGGDPDMTYTAPEKELTAAETEAIEAENRIKQMKKYKEIMDIKGMSKDAAYKSLIDASKIIQEGGNLKEQIKSGSLISNLTQAASKRFDKVSDTETALRSLVAKGEIENELNKETKALDKEYKQSAININKKKLAGSTSAEIQSERMIKGDPFQDQGLATLINMKNNGLNAKVYPSKEMKTNDNALDFITEQINIVNSDPATPLFPAGVYVIKDTIIQVDGEGNVTPIPINAIG